MQVPLNLSAATTDLLYKYELICKHWDAARGSAPRSCSVPKMSTHFRWVHWGLSSASVKRLSGVGVTYLETAHLRS